MLKRFAKMAADEAAAKKAVKDAEEALLEATLRTYPELTEEETRSLVVDDKWLTAIAERIEAEVDGRTEQLTLRCQDLIGRYDTTINALNDTISSFEAKINRHLATMGFDA